MKNRGFDVVPQKKLTVYFKGLAVGDYYADLIINDLIILELKACDYLVKEFEYQLLNYLRATDCEVGLLLNFGKNPNSKEKYFRTIVKQEK